MALGQLARRRSPVRRAGILTSPATITVLLGLIVGFQPPVRAAEPAAPAGGAPQVSPGGAEDILTPAPPTPAADTSEKAATARQTPPSAAPAPAYSPADKDPDDIEARILQALDQPTDLNVQDIPIRQALDKLGTETGIPIQLAPGCLSLLPYGSQTKLTATIQKRPLRESLTALLRPLGLEFVPTARAVTIQPTPPLERIGRRATWEELATLEKLSSQPMTPELFSSLRLQFQDGGGDAVTNGTRLAQAVSAVGHGVAAQVLERACDACEWTWYPEGPFVVILSKTRQVERQLNRRVSVKYVQTLLPEALADLASRAGVLVRFDPGVLSSLPPQAGERFSLSMENATVRQALEVIAGETGLRYVVEPDGVRMTRPGGPAATTPAGGMGPAQVEAAAQATVAALRSNSIVGQLTFPLPDGSSYTLFIRESDLPPEVNALRQAKITKTVNQIRQKLHSEQQQD